MLCSSLPCVSRVPLPAALKEELEGRRAVRDTWSTAVGAGPVTHVLDCSPRFKS